MGDSENSLVILDVAGTLFKTTLATLNKGEEPILLNGKSFRDCGRYFLDRNPETFQVILEYKRTGKLYRNIDVDLDRLEDEARYFCQSNLVNLVKKERVRRANLTEPKRILVYSHEDMITERGQVKPGERHVFNGCAFRPDGSRLFAAEYCSLKQENIFLKEKPKLGFLFSSYLDRSLRLHEIQNSFDKYFTLH